MFEPSYLVCLVYTVKPNPNAKYWYCQVECPLAIGVFVGSTVNPKVEEIRSACCLGW